MVSRPFEIEWLAPGVSWDQQSGWHYGLDACENWTGPFESSKQAEAAAIDAVKARALTSFVTAASASARARQLALQLEDALRHERLALAEYEADQAMCQDLHAWLEERRQAQ